MEWWSRFRSVLPLVAMVAVQCTEVGLSTVVKAAMTKGMSNFVFVVYYKALCTLILLPYVVSRRNRAPLTVPLLVSFFLLGVLLSLFLMLSNAGLKYSSPTLAFAMANLSPIFTYLLAIIFRMEVLDFRSSSGLAKVLGAFVSVLGAFIVILYKGQQILMASSSAEFPHLLLRDQQANWVLGGLLLAIAGLIGAALNIFQTAVVKEFPHKMTTVFFFSLFSTILCAIFTLIVERNPSAWKLRPDIELVAIILSAILNGIFQNGVRTWCLQVKGPVYAVMFYPLGVAIAVVLGFLFLGDPLYLGSVIGAVIIALGFYTVMWGKAKDKTMLIADNVICCFESSSERTPLLQNKPKEEI